MLIVLSAVLIFYSRMSNNHIIKAVISADFQSIAEAAEITPTPTATPTATPTPTVSELENIIAYITRVFEPEGKHVVVKAINCFYSESGLRPNAQGWNPPKLNPDGTIKEPASFDNGVAQLNDYWHKLSEKEKFDVKANIDRAYKIYKARGNFSAWYGKGCKE
jgi:hypothetical protein